MKQFCIAFSWWLCKTADYTETVAKTNESFFPKAGKKESRDKTELALACAWTRDAEKGSVEACI